MTTETTGKPEGEDRDKRAIQLVETLIDEGKVKLYVDVLMEPHIHVADDPHQKDWALGHEHTFEWLGEAFWAKYRDVLTKWEFVRVLPVLRGKARKQEKRDAQEIGLLRVLEKYPVLGLIAEFAESKKNCQKTAKAFYDELQRFAQKRPSWRYGRNNRFPGGPQVLIKIMNICIDSLKQLGVQYGTDRNSANFSVVTLKWIPGDRAAQPPGQAPAVNPAETHELQPADDPEVAERNARRERLERLRQHRQTP